MGKRVTTRKLTLSALMIALSVILGRVFLIPLPWTRGNVNLCDAPIFLAVMILGPWYGGEVGALSGLLLDLISGYAQYAPFSFVAHGLEGVVCGLVMRWLPKRWGEAVGLLAGAVTMVVCYFFADSILYSWVTGGLGIGPNLIQGALGAIIAALLGNRLKRSFNKISGSY